MTSHVFILNTLSRDHRHHPHPPAHPPPPASHLPPSSILSLSAMSPSSTTCPFPLSRALVPSHSPGQSMPTETPPVPEQVELPMLKRPMASVRFHMVMTISRSTSRCTSASSFTRSHT